MKCPSCENGHMKKITVKKYRAKLAGVEFDVDNARFLECDTCDEKAYDAKEIKRWEQILKQRPIFDSVVGTNHYLEAGIEVEKEENKCLREQLGLLQQELAESNAKREGLELREELYVKYTEMVSTYLYDDLEHTGYAQMQDGIYKLKKQLTAANEYDADCDGMAMKIRQLKAEIDSKDKVFEKKERIIHWLKKMRYGVQRESGITSVCDDAKDINGLIEALSQTADKKDKCEICRDWTPCRDCPYELIRTKPKCKTCGDSREVVVLYHGEREYEPCPDCNEDK